MLQFETTAADTEEMLALGAALASVLAELRPGSLVIDLRGDLGAGKTVFVRGLARGLGLPSSVAIVSPTFTIARAYALTGPLARRAGLTALHHLDAYRLRGPDDLESIGFEEMCGNGRLTCVEWGEQVEDALPEDRLLVTLRALPPDDVEPGAAPECPRAVSFQALGPQAARILGVLQGAPRERFLS